MSESLPRIGIIAGTKATDALLCASLEKAGFELNILQYKIPLQAWIPWVQKRVRERGLTVFVGHLLLAIYLRLERLIERLRGQSLWMTELPNPPSWSAIQSKRQRCFKERRLISELNDTDIILLLDSVRLSHRFFRSLPQSCIQIIWGDVPNYLGDSGGYWAYTQGDPVCVTVVARRSQFDTMTVIEHLSVPTNKSETLRTIKIKQAILLQDMLPKILQRMTQQSIKSHPTKSVTCRQFYAPTLWTYLRGTSRRPFPPYAFLEQTCKLSEPDSHL